MTRRRILWAAIVWPVLFVRTDEVLGFGHCPTSIEEVDELKQLNTYANRWPGLYHDHFSTTWTHTSHPNALSQYDFVETLGMTLVNKHGCDCAVEVVQLLDEQMGFGGTPAQPGLFGRVNHKLALKNDRPAGAIDNYLLTGEHIYCVPKYGQCGASVPLKEWFVESEYNSVYTTNTSINNAMGVLFKDVLCYIWPTDYKAGEPALPRLTSPIRTSLPNGAITGVGTQLLECPPLNTTHGDWTLNSLRRTPGTVATLVCHPNYLPAHGSHVVVCQRNYQWMPSVPASCEECKACTPFPSKPFTHITYSAQPIIDDVENKQSYPILTTASLVCSNSTGLPQHSADISVCTTSGWIPASLGHCEKTCLPFTIKNGYILYTDSRGFDQTATVNATIATAVCQPSTKLINGSGSAVCLNGTWSTNNLGVCEWPTCRPVEDVQNGRLLYSTTTEDISAVNSTLHFPGTTVRLQCNTDYSIQGASESVCESQGTWQPRLGRCN